MPLNKKEHKKETGTLLQYIQQLIEVRKQLEHEVRERKKVEEALRASELEIKLILEKERQLSELKSRFVSMASHEFRTPLSTILSSATILGRYSKEDQQGKREKHIHRIKSCVNSLTDILNDFSMLSKLEEGKVENHPIYFQFSELCEQIIDEVQGLLKKGQEIIHTNHDCEATIFFDQRLLKNIIFPLISNAIKYSEENQLIHCTTKTKNNQLIISIKDEGIGIPKSDQKYMFTRFFRAANATNIQGTGLGLNIVKKYVDLMKGQISFESLENEGSTFTVFIPFHKGQK